jgi:16S rRNA (guanine527-N7)-methyltransferase
MPTEQPSTGGDPPQEDRAAQVLFGDRLPLAECYARMLTTDAVERGLVGPREAPRIWHRHLLNCAAIAELVPFGASVTDVGSGAGLPGLVLAVARPDLTVTLVESMARRATFLTEATERLGLASMVTVERCRAEEAPGRVAPADVVTARALAPLDRLASWCLPLARTGGRVLAVKGASAAEEVAAHREQIARLGGGPPVVHRCAEGVLDPPTVVVEITRRTRPVTTSRRRPLR